jgi:hypothetical protein
MSVSTTPSTAKVLSVVVAPAAAKSACWPLVPAHVDAVGHHARRLRSATRIAVGSCPFDRDSTVLVPDRARR